MDIADLEKLAEGREAEIFAWEVGAVVKLFRGPEWAPALDVQTAAMSAAKAAGGPVPAVYGRTEVSGRPGLIMERIDGIDSLTQIGRRPWTILAAGRQLGEMHAALHQIVVEEGALPDARQALRTKLQTSPLVPPHLASFAISALEALPAGDRLLHGDFHPGNIILSATGPVVIDWPNAVRGDPHADVARTLLMLRAGALPPGASPVLHALDRAGRGILRSRYVSAYRARQPFDAKLLARWEVPVAAHRLTEQIEAERPKLLALLEAAAARPPA